MNVNQNISDEHFPNWMFPFKQIPNEWNHYPKRTMFGLVEAEKLVLEKICTKCSFRKPYIEFCILKSGAHDSWCKKCRNTVRQDRRKVRR